MVKYDVSSILCPSEKVRDHISYVSKENMPSPRSTVRIRTYCISRRSRRSCRIYCRSIVWVGDIALRCRGRRRSWTRCRGRRGCTCWHRRCGQTRQVRRRRCRRIDRPHASPATLRARKQRKRTQRQEPSLCHSANAHSASFPFAARRHRSNPLARTHMSGNLTGTQPVNSLLPEVYHFLLALRLEL